jgi:hypothetical protein
MLQTMRNIAKNNEIESLMFYRCFVLESLASKKTGTPG